MNSIESVTPIELTPVEGLTISRLLNSIQFYLECAIIVIGEKGYRLIILHGDSVLMDTHYNTERGAKIAFTKYFGGRAWQDDIKPNWSHAYQPDADWIEQYSQIVKRAQPQSVA
ncbi:MAG: hypothetical protein GY940_15230 [bacterium]|nr:hypothetical protein [bacterium]